jgi:putative protease
MPLELVAPAKNLEQGTLALRCGADAVYAGGPRFGARKGAANEMRDLERLAREAHLWRARLYVTLNTIIFECELEDARRAAWAAFEAGADALVVQDMAFLEMDLPDVPLHASTQAVCDSPEKVAFLASIGFSRAILAREMSLAQMADAANIASAAGMDLEAFVYGALCVSESGRCYLSHCLCGRSGNRGECAQPCRRDWSLLDADGRTLVKDRPLLSIKDLDLSDELEPLADAGVCAFKIEGRLKDADYVKNVVCHTRRKLDALLEKRPELGRASSGRATHAFAPDTSKTFHRGHTKYRLDGARRPIGTGAASGHLGESVGKAVSVSGPSALLDRDHCLAPGDGLAFPGHGGRVSGTVVNAAEGRRIDVQSPAGLKSGQYVFRNFDHAWHKMLRAAAVDRRVGVNARLDFPEGRARLRLCDEDGCSAEALSDEAYGPPKKADLFAAEAKNALSRLGDTPFRLDGCHVAADGFLPLGRLNRIRRQAAELLVQSRIDSHPRRGRKMPDPSAAPLGRRHLGYEWNVSNSLSRAFYARHGAEDIEPALELAPDPKGGGASDQRRPAVMTTWLCLMYEMGWCPRHGGVSPKKSPERVIPSGPLYLKNGTNTLACEFDCERCVMIVVWIPPHGMRTRGL